MICNQIRLWTLLLTFFGSPILASAADADFTGQWTCPGRGVMTLVQKDGKIVGTAVGDANEDWGDKNAKGVRFSGTVKGQTATLTYRCGNGAMGTKTMTLSADGKNFKGEWDSINGAVKFNGVWDGSRQE